MFPERLRVHHARVGGGGMAAEGDRSRKLRAYIIKQAQEAEKDKLEVGEAIHSPSPLPVT